MIRSGGSLSKYVCFVASWCALVENPSRTSGKVSFTNASLMLSTFSSLDYKDVTVISKCNDWKGSIVTLSFELNLTTDFIFPQNNLETGVSCCFGLSPSTFGSISSCSPSNKNPRNSSASSCRPLLRNFRFVLIASKTLIGEKGPSSSIWNF